MSLNPPRKVRAAIYIFSVLATPLVIYARSKGYIGDLEVALWSAEQMAVLSLAAVNTNNTVK